MSDINAPLDELVEQANHRDHIMGHIADAVALMATGGLGGGVGYIVMCTIPNPSYEANGGPSTMVHLISNLEPKDLAEIMAGYAANPALMPPRG